MPRKDYSRKAGGEALAARLRRVSDQMDRDGARFYATQGVLFEQRWYGIINQLLLNGPMTIGSIAESLRVTHVSISQASRSLEEEGIVKSRRGSQDKRQRTLALTSAGKALVARLAPLWAAFNQSAAELNAEIGDLVMLIDRLEDALARKSLYDRLVEKTADSHSP